jgi:hypothetical protein
VLKAHIHTHRHTQYWQSLRLQPRLKAHTPRAGARAVILAPTRELALQTHKVVRELGRGTDLRTAVLVGGDAMEAQFAELALNPDILVATPGEHMARCADGAPCGVCRKGRVDCGGIVGHAVCVASTILVLVAMPSEAEGLLLLRLAAYLLLALCCMAES